MKVKFILHYITIDARFSTACSGAENNIVFFSLLGMLFLYFTRIADNPGQVTEPKQWIYYHEYIDRKLTRLIPRLLPAFSMLHARKNHLRNITMHTRQRP